MSGTYKWELESLPGDIEYNHNNKYDDEEEKDKLINSENNNEINIKSSSFSSSSSSSSSSSQYNIDSTEQKESIFNEYDLKIALGSINTDVERTTATKLDIILMIFINFLSFVCFAIVLNSVALFVQKFTDNQIIVGVAVAANSFGTFIASPILGFWADWRSVREALLLSLIVLVGGNVLYALAMNEWIIIASRFIVGIGAANYAPATTYLAYATKKSQRTQVMTINSAAGIFGFILGPACALGLSFFKIEVYSVKFDKFTNGAWASVVLSIIAMFFLIFFREVKRPIPKTKDGNNTVNHKNDEKDVINEDSLHKDYIKFIENETYPSSSSSSSSSSSYFYSSSFPYFATTSCLILQFSLYSSFTVFETVATLYTHDAYKWGVTSNGFLFLGIGLVSVLAIIFLYTLTYFFQRDNFSLLFFVVITLVGFCVVANYPFKKAVDVYRFCIGTGIATFGFTAAVSQLLALYSKILNNYDQGFFMGLISASGSIARTVGPLSATAIYSYGGPSLLIDVVAVMLVLSVLLTVISLKVLSLPNDYEDEEDNNSVKDKTIVYSEDGRFFSVSSGIPLEENEENEEEEEEKEKEEGDFL